MVNRIYPSELQLNRANTSDTEAPFLDLHLSISNGFVSSKTYDKCDDFDADIVNFPFLDGDVPSSTSYGVYISQLITATRKFLPNQILANSPSNFSWLRGLKWFALHSLDTVKYILYNLE